MVDDANDVERAIREIHPSLYDEARTGLLSAFLMFCLPDLRDMARQSKLEGDRERIQRILDLPCTLTDIFAVFEENRSVLTSEKLKDEERAQMYADSLSASQLQDMLGDYGRQRFMDSVKIVVFSDHDQENDIVYMVVVSPLRKRVGVVFRGSVTPKDFRQDAKALLSGIRNPVAGDLLPDEIGVHLGFREYLYKQENLMKVLHRPRMYKKVLSVVPKISGRTVEASTKPVDDESTPGSARPGISKKVASKDLERPLKYQIIIEQVLDQIEDNPGFTLYIAGHSLGGALSTLFSLEAAADERIPGPVTCITSGAPKVGNIEFLHVYEELERRGRLRCIQVANDQDPVPKSPPNGSVNPCHALLCQSRRYRHVGIHVTLRSSGHIITYPPQVQTYLGVFLCDCMLIGRFWLMILFLAPVMAICYGSCFVLAIPCTVFCLYKTMTTSRKHHTQLKYLERLDAGREDLETLTLDELNERRWKRPRWRVPILHRFHRESQRGCCNEPKKM